MQWKKIENAMDFDTIGFYFEGLSSERIKVILKNYYINDSTLKDISEKLDMNIQSKKLRQHFPKLKTTLKCKYDENIMYVELPNKQNFKKEVLAKSIPFCLSCGHEYKEDCKCDHCLEEKREKIYDIYTNEKDINLENCNLFDRLLIATLLQGMHARDMENPFGSYNDFKDEMNPIFFDDTYAFRQFERLNNDKFITVSADSPISSFKDGKKFPKVFNPYEVLWQLNIVSNKIENEKLFDFLKHPNPSIVENQEHFIGIWYEIVLEELKRLVIAEIIEFNFSFSHDTDKEKIENHIKRLLRLYNPGHIYSLFWMAIRRADNNRTRGTWGKYAYHHIDFILKIVEQVERQKQRENDLIKTYNFPRDMSTTLVTKIFFQEIALEPNWFSKMIPDQSHVLIRKEERNFYERLMDKENQVFNDFKLDVNYFYFTTFGIIVNDGTVDWLFTDEKTLFLISKIVGFEDNKSESKEFYYHLKLPYFINEVYSTRYLFSLLDYLIESESNYTIPENDMDYKKQLENQLKEYIDK